MKQKILYLGLSSLFLFGCTSIKESDYNSIKQSIENKEDFIFLISSKTCAHCQALKTKLKRQNISTNVYDVNIDNIDEGIKNNEAESIESYKYFADLTLNAYNNIESYAFDDTYREIVGLEYGDEKLYGKDEYLEGYINIVFPLTFFYVDGKIEGFEIGDFSMNIQKVLEEYKEDLKDE